jgi:hypothetical protein
MTVKRFWDEAMGRTTRHTFTLICIFNHQSYGGGVFHLENSTLGRKRNLPHDDSRRPDEHSRTPIR